MADIIVRRAQGNKGTPMCSDADKFDILRRFKLGQSYGEIGKSKDIPEVSIKEFIELELRNLNVVAETQRLINTGSVTLSTIKKSPKGFLNEDFLDKVDDAKEAYAFHYAMTGSNEVALAQSGLDQGFPKAIRKEVLRHALAVRGKYMRELPGIQEYINEIREKKIKDLDITKVYIQSELVEQIDQLKELAGDNARYRGHILKAVELLGRTIDAFTDTLRIEEADPKSGLEILMKKAKEEIAGVTTYEADDEEED
jgi:hypothetical protein